MAASRLAAAVDVVTELTDCVTVIDTEQSQRKETLQSWIATVCQLPGSAPARPETIHLKQQTIQFLNLHLIICPKNDILFVKNTRNYLYIKLCPFNLFLGSDRSPRRLHLYDSLAPELIFQHSH